MPGWVVSAIGAHKRWWLRIVRLQLPQERGPLGQLPEVPYRGRGEMEAGHPAHGRLESCRGGDGATREVRQRRREQLPGLGLACEGERVVELSDAEWLAACAHGHLAHHGIHAHAQCEPLLSVECV